MRRTLVAHVIFPRPDPVRPVLGFSWDAARSLLATRDLDVDVLVPLPIRSVRTPASLIRNLRGAPGWPDDIEERLRELEPRPTLIPYLPLPNRSIESATFAIAAHLLAKPRAGRPAVVHGSFLDQGGFAAAMAARVIGAPSIAVAHGTDVRAARGELDGDTGRRRRARSTLESATKVIAVSNHLAHQLALCGSRAELVRFTTNADRFPLQPLPNHGVAPEVLFVGHQSRAKGVDLLIEAFAKLAHPTAKLVLVGSPSSDLDPRAEADRLGIGARVIVCGEVPQEELVGHYARSTCVVLPSRAEGFGIVLVEGLLVGRPVIGADVGGIRDIVDDSIGALFPSEDPRALSRAIDDVLARAHAGAFKSEKLRSRALPMTWEHAGPRLAELTRKLIVERAS